MNKFDRLYDLHKILAGRRTPITRRFSGKGIKVGLSQVLAALEAVSSARRTADGQYSAY